MTPKTVLTLLLAVPLAGLAGCLAGQTQVTHCLAQPLVDHGRMGKVALFSLVSGFNPKRKPDKDALEVRESLKRGLESMPGTQVVLSKPVPEEAIPSGSSERLAAALPYARSTAITARVDTVCLVHLKHGSGYLSLGVPQLARVWGECDYDLVIIDAQSGRELLVSSGTWSDGVGFPKIPQVPSPSHVGQSIAQVLKTPSTAHAPSLTPEALTARSPSQISR
jgi:hypothetical protein